MLECRCAWEGCENAGEYRAPKDRRLAEYFHFCLDHVRVYNAKWDFHAGMGADQLEAEIRSAATWERPTWKLGTLGGGPRAERMHVNDPFGFTADMPFGAKKRRSKTRDEEYVRDDQATRSLLERSLAERHSAMKVLQLTAPLTLEQLKRSYKALVKKHHPDANGGSHEAEDRMKTINQAYQTLRASLVPAG